MEQVGYDPYSIHSTVHTLAYNYMKNNQPTNTVVTVSNAITSFNIYTLQGGVDKIEMFVGSDANSIQTKILTWNKKKEIGLHSISNYFFSIHTLSFLSFIGPLINHFLFYLISLLVVHGE